MDKNLRVITTLILFAIASNVNAEEKKKTEKVSFEKQIKPIFETRCVHCHNRETLPDRGSFEKAEFAFAPDKFGKIYILPGKPDSSLLVQAIEKPNFHEMMMPMVGERTKAKEIALIRKWVAEGAVWPKGKAGKVKVTFRAKE